MTNNDIDLRAVRWLEELRQAHPSKERWREFEAWLNEDHRHRTAFNAVESASEPTHPSADLQVGTGGGEGTLITEQAPWIGMDE